jgi:hypothetical protein
LVELAPKLYHIETPVKMVDDDWGEFWVMVEHLLDQQEIVATSL